MHTCVVLSSIEVNQTCDFCKRSSFPIQTSTLLNVSLDLIDFSKNFDRSFWKFTTTDSGGWNLHFSDFYVFYESVGYPACPLKKEQYMEIITLLFIRFWIQSLMPLFILTCSVQSQSSTQTIYVTSLIPAFSYNFQTFWKYVSSPW